MKKDDNKFLLLILDADITFFCLLSIWFLILLLFFIWVLIVLFFSTISLYVWRLKMMHIAILWLCCFFILKKIHFMFNNLQHLLVSQSFGMKHLKRVPNEMCDKKIGRMKRISNSGLCNGFFSFFYWGCYIMVYKLYKKNGLNSLWNSLKDSGITFETKYKIYRFLLWQKDTINVKTGSGKKVSLTYDDQCWRDV